METDRSPVPARAEAYQRTRYAIEEPGEVLGTQALVGLGDTALAEHVEDAREILTGADDAATQYFRRTLGDRLTGEVKGLERGKLAFKTDPTGTIKIEWLDVASLESIETFEVDLTSGERLSRDWPTLA